MALILGDLYKALKEAGASEESAQKAAAEVAEYRGQWNSIDRTLKDIMVMLGVNTALTFGLVLLVLRIPEMIR
jgi:hypothetical protein